LNVNKSNDRRETKKPLDLSRDPASKSSKEDTFEEMNEAAKKGTFFGKFQNAFHEMLESSRGSEANDEPVFEPRARRPMPAADDLAIRRARNVTVQHMIVPEGVIIQGSLMSGTETEISGRVEGDVNVEGRLFLGQTALITGNVRATNCKVEGLVEGKMECSNEIELGRNGRLNADALAGKRIIVAGQALGTVSCGGIVHLVASGRIEGDIRAKQLVMEEGSSFNGRCTMRTGSGTPQKTEPQKTEPQKTEAKKTEAQQ